MRIYWFSLMVAWSFSVIAAEKDAAHWSFQPMQDPVPPAVKNAEWCRTPMDQFVLARLEAAGMQPAAESDRRTFIRRAYFDLIGLPPTFAQVEAFVTEASPDAYEKVVDALLASPHYGERWGRHWLDIARFADTRGYLVGNQNQNFPYAYTYRDYVIDAFNYDKPYDAFVREQLAADQLDIGEDKNRLAAMGFLTVGRRFLNKQDEIIDDRIDVVSRGLMGLTVYCSRCHDHKYDPVPTAEYYSLYSIFDNSEEPEDLPVIKPPDDSEGYKKYQAEWDKRHAEAEKKYTDIWKGIQKDISRNIGDYMEEIARKAHPEMYKGLPDPAYEKKNTLRRAVSERWERYFRRNDNHSKPFWLLAFELRDVPPDAFKARFNELLPRVQPALAERMQQSPPNNYVDVITLYGRFFRELADVPDEQLTPGQKEVREWMATPDAPVHLTRDAAKQFFNRKERDAHRNIVTKIRDWESTSPDAPPRAMILTDKPQQHDNYVFVRGKRGNNGPKVTRQFLSVASPDQPRPYTKGSGRLELANSILDDRNPFTWRVIVNRVWQHHFGEGMVRTTSDFGTRGEMPSHPELLDYLAQQFIRNGKTFKKLHREIMLSATYRMASTPVQDDSNKDPDNRLLSHMNRQRLAMEPMRDALLAVSGRLDRRVGGRSVKDVIHADANRRTLYGFVNRQDVPGFYRSFDFANPDATTGNRPETTVPQQALFAMNSPFMRRQAESVMAAIEKGGSAEQRITQAYRSLLARDPHPDELKLAVAYVQDDGLDGFVRFAQVLMMSNEFLFID